MYVNFEQIKEVLNEQKWTRGALSAFSQSTLEEILALCEPEMDQDDATELLELANSYLNENKNSVVPLFLAGLMSLELNSTDDIYMTRLITLFTDVHKTSVVELICKTVLKYGENRLALVTLIDNFKQLGKEAERIEALEQLVRIDFTASHEALELAHHYEKKDDIPTAIGYYKKALYRFINQKAFAQEEEAWTALLKLIPNEKDFFLHLQNKVYKIHDAEKVGILLSKNILELKSQERWQDVIEFQKILISYTSDDNQLRKDLVASYRKRYASHSHLEEYIRISGLTGDSWKNIFEAIDEFEKHIAFDAGTFVYHRTWGVGRIRDINESSLIVDFADKERRGHEMGLAMAIQSLEPLVKNHIWILKGVVPKDKLKERVQKDLTWALKTIIESFDNKATLKKIKSELVPDILTTGEWTGWQTKAKQILLTDSSFGNTPEDANSFMVRETPIGFDEKTFNTFRSKQGFWDKTAIIKDFLVHSDPESEFFGEMFSHFVNGIGSNDDETSMGSFLVVQGIVKQFPYLRPNAMPEFEQILSACTTPLSELYLKLQSEDFRALFMKNLAKSEEWEAPFLELLPVAMHKKMVKSLEKAGRHADVTETFQNAVSRYKEFPDLLIWLARTYDREHLVETYSIDYERFVLALLGLYAFSFRMISTRRDLSENRKRNRYLHNTLFDDNTLLNFLMDSDDENLVLRTMSLMSEITDMKDDVKVELRHKLSEKYPALIQATHRREASLAMNAAPSESNKLFTLESSYIKKQEELRQIIEVEIPENSNEIAVARAHGDLSENAEFKAAKEKQGMLRAKVEKIQEEMSRAVMVKLEDVKGDQVAFGTRVVIERTADQETKTFIILGPWESNLEAGIISNNSPLAQNLMGHHAGETISFETNGTKHSYKIVELRAISLEDLK